MPTIQVTADTEDYIVIDNLGYWDNVGSVRETGDRTSSQYDLSAAYRFPNVTIPAGATIDTADISAVAANRTNGATVDLYGENADDPARQTSYADFVGRTLTTATVNWNPIAWAQGVRYNDNEIKTIIQEIVDRGGWASGQAMSIFWMDATGAGWGGSDETLDVYGYAFGPGTNPMYLNVTYTAASLGGVPRRVASAGQMLRTGRAQN